MTLSTAASPTRQAPADEAWGWDPGWPFLIALAGALTLIRIAALIVSPSDLGFDEAQYWAWSRDFAFGYFTKPPMIAWVIGLETRVCGSGAACVRAASPIFHFATALVLAAMAARFYGRRTGVWTGTFYLLMPGVAVSSFLMTTDVFLLFFWSVAIFALLLHVERPRLGTALLFGVATGLGLYAKYAMVYLPAMVAIAGLFVPALRRALMRRETALGLGVALLVIAPNLWWNATNGFATFEHTGGNIGWSLSRLNLTGGFEFLAAQLGVAAPAIFLTMIAALLLGARSERPDIDRLLLWLSWPILVAITLQGFLSQANANWGATAYPAGLVLASAIMVHRRWRFFLWSNLVLCAAVSLGILLGTATVDPTTAHGPLKQLRQLGGWTEAGQGIAALARERGARRLVVNGRGLTSGLLWALRDTEIEVLALLPHGRHPSDQFQLDRPWSPGDATERTLLIGVGGEAARALGARPVAQIAAPIYAARDGTISVYGFGE